MVKKKYIKWKRENATLVLNFGLSARKFTGKSIVVTRICGVRCSGKPVIIVKHSCDTQALNTLGSCETTELSTKDRQKVKFLLRDYKR